MEEEKQQNISSEIICVFQTNLDEKYKVQDDQQYTVQTNFTEKNLTELISHILTEESPELEDELENLKFEFLINGEFLRGNIKSHLIKHKVSTEQEIVIQYTFGLSKPQEGKKQEEEDWVSHIEIIDPFKTHKQSPFVASLFSGDLSFYDKNMNLLTRTNLSDMAVKQSVVTSIADRQVVISGCQDNLIRIGQFKQEKKGKSSYQAIANCVGNDSSVNCIDVNPVASQQFCSGSFSGKLAVYSISESEIEKAENKAAVQKNGKKMKLEEKNLAPIQESNNQHSEQITRCLWKNQNQIYTSSFDHTVKLFDSQKVTTAGHIQTKDSAVTTFTFQKELVLTGHEDSYIKTYDFRDPQKGAQQIFKSHSLWISDLQFLPNNDHIFMSSSFDHSIKIWDLRSTFPVCTLKSHKDKIFSLAWNGDSQILSAGSDQSINSYNFVQQQQK